ncbi:MAG: FlgD immunoglobulin-like domain containing protein [Candidatus Eisenbacteria bacterium]
MPREPLVLATLAVVAATFAVVATPLSATVHLVDQGGGGDFTTIGAAVSAASPADTVLIAAGTYQGAGNTNVDLGGKNLVIRSESGAANTIIDCERIGPNTRAFYLHSGEDTTCVIEDLTVLRGYAISGAAIWCDGASPKIVSCRFDSCGVAYGTVRLDNSAARIIGCAFSNCTVFVVGAGIYSSNSSPVIRSTTFDSCSSGFHGGGMILLDGGSATLTDVTLTGCSSGGDGGGIYCQDAPPTFTRVHFVGNVADSTSGGGLYTNCDVTLNECTFVGNYAGQEGGGVYCRGSYLDVNDCTFSGNDGSAGGGIYGEDALLDIDGGSFYDNVAGMGGGVCAQGGIPMVDDVSFDMNGAAIYGGGLAFLDALGGVDSCTFTDNDAWSGAAIYFDGPADPTVDLCTLSGNTSALGGNCALLCEGCDPTITNTIVAFTVDGSGMGCESGASPTTTHSCFYGNAEGDGLCGSYSNNLFDDPLFCAGPTDNVWLHDDSPFLPAGNPWSEQIGSRGAGGCGPSSGIDETAGSLVLFPARPNPAAGSATIEWAAPVAAGEARVAIYDPAGRLVHRARVAAGADGSGRYVWSGRDDSGNEVASGLYLVRVESGGQAERGTVVVVR